MTASGLYHDILFVKTDVAETARSLWLEEEHYHCYKKISVRRNRLKKNNQKILDVTGKEPEDSLVEKLNNKPISLWHLESLGPF